MGKLGISVFSGLEQTVEQNLNYLKIARQLGYSKLFTSLHIPESNAATLFQDVCRILSCAADFGFEVTADISPETWRKFGIVPAHLNKMGIGCVRIDYGISPAETLELIATANVKIELNASVLSEADLLVMLDAGLAADCLSACHNYYPRPDTGLSYQFFVEQSRKFSSRKISVGAFIPGLQAQRGPIFAGLPTVETHRQMCSTAAVRQIWASGCIDAILWGDPLIDELALRQVASLQKPVSSAISLHLIIDNIAAHEKSLVFLPLHVNRCDAAAFVVRSQDSRKLCCQPILQHNQRKRMRGDVTLDNINYGRYMGELQIVLQDLPADDRVNVIGRIDESDLCLIDCIGPGRQFCFREEAQ